MEKMVAKNREKWRKMKQKFHEEVSKKKCAACGNSKVEGYIRAKPVCNECFKLIRLDNLKLFGKEDIPKNLKLYKHEIDKRERKRYSKYLKKSGGKNDK